MMLKPVMPEDAQRRKDVPLARGVLDYFPAALAAVAEVSVAGNKKHNPGEELHWSRGKSGDHADTILRHLADRGLIDPEDGLRHSAKLVWRALALLQEELEAEGQAPGRGSRFPEAEDDDLLIAIDEPELRVEGDPALNPDWAWGMAQPKVTGDIGNAVGQFRFVDGAWRRRIA